MSYLYVDTSVLVSVAIGDKRRTQNASSMLERFKQILCSEIAVVEGQSGISFHFRDDDGRLRSRAEQNFNRILARMNLFEVSSLVLGHARTLVSNYRKQFGLRTLDAIHVATANLVRQGVSPTDEPSFEYLTADSRQHQVFTAEGYVGHLIQ